MSLPAEYQEVAYLSSSGTQYIDTLVKLSSTDTVKCKFEITNNSINYSYREGIYGTMETFIGGNNTFFTLLMRSPTLARVGTSSNEVTSTNLVLNKIYDTQLSNGTYIEDGITYTFTPSSSFTFTTNCYLFQRNQASMLPTYAKVYSFEIVGKFNGIPCYRKSDNEPGFYDTVSNTFFTNAGTGAFVVGPIISKPPKRFYLGNVRVNLHVNTPAPIPPQTIYGVKMDRTLNSNAPLGEDWCTYTDSATGLSAAYMDFANDVFVDNGWYNRWPFNSIKPCIVKNGSVVGYLKKDDYTKYENGTTAPITDLTAGNVCVEIPKIYYKISSDAQYNYVQISDQTFDGACCLAHTFKGQEYDKIFVDAYLSGGSDWETYGPHSNSGTEPAPMGVTLSYSTMYPKIKPNRGNNCEPMTYNVYTLICALYTIMFKNTNSRDCLGIGLYKYTTTGVYTGALNQKGFCYGENTTVENDPVKGRIKLFGMEDFYGGRMTYMAGAFLDQSGNLRIIDPTSSTSSYAPDDLDNMPVANISNDYLPLPSSSDLVPVKLAGINSLGFLRTNQSVSATDVSTNEDVGFCSVTKFANTNANYKIMVFSRGFLGNSNGQPGMFSIQQYTVASTNRRAFRIVEFANNN